MLESNKIYQGDCLELMQNIQPKSINMVLTDLPYGMTQNKWDSIIPLDKLWNLWDKITTDNAIIALTASQPFTSMLVMSNLKMFKHEWIWIKNRGSNFANTVREPFKEHESVLIFSKGKWTYNKQMQERTGGGLDRVKYDFNSVTDTTNYNEFNSPSQSKGKNLRVPSSWQKFNTEVGLHPTQKPVSLFMYLINTYTNKNDIILDNCAGSGTTGVAAIQTERNYILIENDPTHFLTAKNRVENYVRIK